MFGELSPGNYEAFPKNPNIANIFTQIGRAEELGTGVRKVFQYIKMYSGCERALFREEDLFTVKIPSVGMKDDWDSIVGETVGENGLKILQLISNNPFITRSELSEEIGLSVRGIEWNLLQLREKGILKRMGATKKGYWKIVRRLKYPGE